MALLDELASALATAGCGTVGVSLFKSLLPDAPGGPDPCLGLVEYASGPVLRTAGPVGTALAERPRIQVLVRSADYQVARTRALAVVAALDWLGNTTLTASSGGGTRYAAIEVLQRPPVPLGRDANDRWRFAVNLEATRMPAA